MEAKAAICKMKRGKAAGPDEITLEMALALEEEGIIWLYRVMDAIWKEKKLEVVQMRCLLTMRGVTRRERMRNEVIRQELKMAELREKIRKCIRNTRWYGHVKRMEENEFVSWSAERREPGTRCRDDPPLEGTNGMMTMMMMMMVVMMMMIESYYINKKLSDKFFSFWF